MGYTSLGTNRNQGDRTGLCIFITLPNCVGTPKTCQVWSLSEYTPTSIHGPGLQTIAESLLSAKVKLKLLWSNPFSVYKLLSRNQCTNAPRVKKDQHLILIFSRWFYAWFFIMKGLKDLPLFWQTDYRSLKYVFIIIWSGSNCVFVFFTWLHSDSCFNSSMVLSVILLLSIKRFFMNIYSHTAFMNVPHAGHSFLSVE